jgi:hypothetical protein
MQSSDFGGILLEARGRRAIGTRVKVFWNPQQKWSHGRITSFAPRTNEYLVRYDEGCALWENHKSLYLLDEGEDKVKLHCKDCLYNRRILTAKQ